MAGDWIKMRGNLWDDPRISRVCDITDQPEAMVVGGLYWLWASADQHTEDGCMPGLTLRGIDRKTGIQGFGEALVTVGWLADHPEGVRIVNFEEHNGESAKRRCSDAKRKANSRGSSADVPQDVREVADKSRTENGQVRTDCGAREEKRREERKEEQEQGAPARQSAPPPSPPPDFDGLNAKALNGKSIVAIAPCWELPSDWGEDAEALGFQPGEVLRESERFRQYWVAGNGKGKRRSVKGWRQSWSNWLGKAAEQRR